MNPTEKEQIDEEVLKNQEESVSNEEAAEAEVPEAEAPETETDEELTGEALLQKQLTEAEEKIAEREDKYLRLSAEFDNYRKRTMKEKADLIKSAGEKVIADILPVIDDLERAMQTMKNAEDVEAISQGVELIYHKFLKALSQEGLKKIETEGKDFDTDFHEAIAMIPAQSEEQKGKILDCVQTGYTLNDKVIRHAKVAVAQ